MAKQFTGLKIAHISDLHFCAPQLKDHLCRLREAVSKKLKAHLDIEFCLNGPLEALAETIHREDPDVIVVSGDVTTFGDPASFAIAGEWLKGLLPRQGGFRYVVIVPGNHDVLGGQLRSLLTRLDSMPWYARFGLKRWASAAVRDLKKCLDEAGISRDADGDLFGAFNRFMRSNDAFNDKSVTVSIDKHSEVLIAPFNSVSSDPVWMNLGEHRRREEVKLFDKLAPDDPKARGRLRIAVLHHNPFSSPNVVEPNLVNAYNSMPGGAQFLKRLQMRGVDIVLHGHQHEDALLLYDYDLATAGHAFCVGARSSTATDNAAFNMITIRDVNLASLEQYVFDHTTFVAGPRTVLCLERHRPPDESTQVVRLEVKRFLPGLDNMDEDSLWEEIYEQGRGAGYFYISGRKLEHFRSGRHRELSQMLDRDTKVRVLVSDPEFLKRLVEADSKSNSNIWGGAESLRELAVTAQAGCHWWINEYLPSLSQKQRSNLEIRLAQTLLPFAATVAGPETHWGKMVLRLLPVGAVGDLPKPVLKLNRRSSNMLYDHYLGHLKQLLRRAPTLGPQWSHGTSDLVDNV